MAAAGTTVLPGITGPHGITGLPGTTVLPGTIPTAIHGITPGTMTGITGILGDTAPATITVGTTILGDTTTIATGITIIGIIIPHIITDITAA